VKIDIAERMSSENHLAGTGCDAVGFSGLEKLFAAFCGDGKG